MSVRGKEITQIVLERIPTSNSVHIIAYAADGDRLVDRFLFRPFWDDQFQHLKIFIERETK